MHSRVEVGIVATLANDDFLGRVGRFQYLFRDQLAGQLQPAFVHVLEHRELLKVGLLGRMGAVEADQDPVQGDAALNRRQVAVGKVRELRPAVDGGELQGHVRFGMEEFVFVVLQVQQVAGLAVLGAGVGAARRRSVQAQQNLFALDLADRDDVDATEEVGALSDLVVEFLGVGGLHCEGAGGVVDVIGLGHVLLELLVLRLGAFAEGSH